MYMVEALLDLKLPRVCLWRSAGSTLADRMQEVVDSCSKGRVAKVDDKLDYHN